MGTLSWWLSVGILAYLVLCGTVSAMTVSVLVAFWNQSGRLPHSFRMAFSYILALTVIGMAMVAHPEPYTVLGGLAVALGGFDGVFRLVDFYLIPESRKHSPRDPLTY